MFPNEHANHNNNEDNKQDDALDGEVRFLVLLGFVQLLHSFLRVLHCILHVVIDTIQNCSLNE